MTFSETSRLSNKGYIHHDLLVQSITLDPYTGTLYVPWMKPFWFVFHLLTQVSGFYVDVAKMWGEADTSKLRREEYASEEHPALKIFVVLKGIFRHMSNPDLVNARLVDRQWNFAAMSELVSRKCRLSAVKLHSFSSNRSRDRDYGWYLDFENTRRSLWTDLYGTDCPMIEFHHLQFNYPEKTQDFLSILRSPWLTSMTSLTVSMYSETFQELIVDWLIPSLPNLQNLSCIINSAVEIEPTLSDAVKLNRPDDCNRRTVESTPNSPFDSKGEGRKRRSSSKVHSVSVSFEEACSFPWTLLDSFLGLENLTLEYTGVVTFIKCAEVMSAGSSPREVGNLQLTLTHQQKPHLREQVEEAELHAEAFAIANAKLCNQFRVRASLNVVSMIPAAGFLGFLKHLKATGPKKIKFEVAAPCDKSVNEGRLRQFIAYMIPEIHFKFPNLNDLHLQYLQYFSKTNFVPVQNLWRRQILQFVNPTPRWGLKQLNISTITAETESCEEGLMYLPIPHCQRFTVYNRWFQDLVQLVAEISCWEDCAVVINAVGLKLKSIKKLVLRGSPDVLEPIIDSLYFFPQLNRVRFPKDWFYGSDTGGHYEGLPAIQSLEVFCLERFGVYYNPEVETEIRRMPQLKSIHLDADFNGVVSRNSFSSPVVNEIKPSPRKVLLTTYCDFLQPIDKWPSSVGHVQILTKLNGS